MGSLGCASYARCSADLSGVDTTGRNARHHRRSAAKVVFAVVVAAVLVAAMVAVGESVAAAGAAAAAAAVEDYDELDSKDKSQTDFPSAKPKHDDRPQHEGRRVRHTSESVYFAMHGNAQHLHSLLTD